MPALLDFPVLLLPIPGDDPAGTSVPYEIKLKFEEGRKEDNPADFGDDPERQAQLRKADWRGIVRLAEETLTQVSKDLLVAARLTEALVRMHGFAGLRDGLHLLREMVEQCWDRLHPPLEEDDLERRAAPFYWLDEPDKGARLPNVLRTTPLIFGEKGGYSLLTIRGMPPQQPAVNPEEFNKVLLASSAEDCARVAEEVDASREERNKLTAALSEKMGAAAPGLTAIHQALDECRVLSQEILKRKGPVSSPETNIPGKESAQPSTSAGPAAPPSSRAEAYQQLSRAASTLRQLEPHSPIPYLVLRAVELGSLEYPELIKALIRDANVLNELNREMGIKPPPTE